MAPPVRSVIIWFSQRVGSTLLAQALEDTSVAGKPQEWLNAPDVGAIYDRFGVSGPVELKLALWRRASTPNGVVGIKYGVHEPHHANVQSLFREAAGGSAANDGEAWESFFPGARHVFIKRRDAVRQAVSWWRAIQSGQWHRPTTPAAWRNVTREHARDAVPPDRLDAYDAEALDHLIEEARRREASIERHFSRLGITPLEVVYEDLVGDWSGSLRRVIDALELPTRDPVALPAPGFAPIADAVSEAWAERYRAERRLPLT